ncbi:MAG: hypothetical protein HOP25_06240 [Methylotenera sp.]|nr:hypothetical protein [Methylotenera sp.]
MTTNWKSIYHHDKDGNRISGSIEKLVSGVNAGRAVRIAVHNADDENWRFIFEPSTVFSAKGRITAQHIFIASQQDSHDPHLIAVIQPIRTIVQNYSTTGRVYSVSKANENEETKDTYSWPLEWFLAE